MEKTVMAKIKGTKKKDVLKGLSNKDKVIGLGGEDKLIGLAGDDKLVGGAGSDKLSGGGGNDILKAGAGDDQLKGGKGNDMLLAGLGNDVLKGGEGNDHLDAGDGDDVVLGEAGDDFMVAGTGKDMFSGGDGIDMIDYSASAGNVGVSLASGKGTYSADGDTYNGIENVIGSAFADVLFGTYEANFFVGGAGNDTLMGEGGNDRLEGGAGDDWLYGGDGADAFIGGEGTDTVSYSMNKSGIKIDLLKNTSGLSANGDTFDGIEDVWGSYHDDAIAGTDGANEIRGQDGNDLIAARGGKDTIYAGEGMDGVSGGDGDDRVFAGEAQAVMDQFYGDGGNDWIDYSTAGGKVTVSLTTGVTAFHAADDVIVGFENILGSRYDDTLQAAVGGRAYGHDGDDIVIDSTGTEVLRGGEGLDTLTDGIGLGDTIKDIFFLEKGMGEDTVIGFTKGVDQMWFSESQFGELGVDGQGNLLAGRLVNDSDGNGMADATAGYAQLIFDTLTTKLYYDADGTGGKAAVHLASVNAVDGNALIASDFLVVPDI
jgi:Ca2+-binding RTX toxin-like protein